MRNLILLPLVFLIGILNAQQSVQLNGTIKDSNVNPVDLALVILMSLPDSVYVNSEYTDTDGSFKFRTISSGSYNLQVRLLGYESTEQNIEINSSHGDIILDPIIISRSVQILEEITVTSKLPFIERQIDRTIINPDALILNAGSNALEVLDKAPSIIVDADGSILLKGRSGVAIYINGKPSYLSGNQLENYLRSLSSGSIKKIEIMTNPPAKFEAAGDAGVINILTKKNALTGLHGSTTIGYRQGKYGSSNNSLSLNYNKEKISLYSNINTGFWKFYHDLNINRYFRNIDGERLSSFAQNAYNFREGDFRNIKIGIDYYISDATTYGLSYQRNHSPTFRKTDNVSLVRDGQEILQQRVVADNIDDGSFDNNHISTYVNYKIDTLGSSISLDFDYVDYTTTNDQKFINLLYDPDDILTFQDQVNGSLQTGIKIYTVKTDYTKSISDGSKLEAGLKSALSKTDNETIYSTTTGNNTVPNYDLSNKFIYDEQIHSGYLNYNRLIGRLNIQAGLRAESTILKGNQLGNVERPDTSFTRRYTSIFPTFYTAMGLDSSGNNQLTLSYGRRINRPYFQDLNPYIRPLDKFTLYGGNPNLLPTYSHNLSLAHSYKNLLTTTVQYSKTIDAIRETLEIKDGIYYSRPGNIANSEVLLLSLQSVIRVTDGYDVNAYAELAHQKFESKLYTETLKSKGTYLHFSVNNDISLGKGWTTNLGGWYRSDLVTTQFIILNYWMVNMGLKKKILDGKGDLKLSVSDVFHTRRGSGIINNLYLADADWNSKYDSQRATISFSLRFGKSTSSKMKYKSTGSESEQNRVKV